MAKRAGGESIMREEEARAVAGRTLEAFLQEGDIHAFMESKLSTILGVLRDAPDSSSIHTDTTVSHVDEPDAPVAPYGDAALPGGLDVAAAARAAAEALSRSGGAASRRRY
eukprot:PLAT3832.2.p2 GENE.PLAT3832.2~~PLAT3832.2.p2  ORF type:complete len:111 (+),score=27.06 PLAT3832.2:735-1067(+)